MIGNTDAALAQLDAAINGGYRLRLWYHLYTDPSFDRLWSEPGFIAARERAATLLAAEAAKAASLRELLPLVEF